MTAPISVVMISLNEAHQMEGVLDNLDGWAQAVYLVDSYSQDRTVDIALERGVYVVQRRFRDFGDQWNFALRHLSIETPWTMKMDPDERLSDALKAEIEEALQRNEADALLLRRKLWLMNKPVCAEDDVLRIWRTGTCRFTDVIVNERPVIEGRIDRLGEALEHHDSPNLHHWYDKQNHYMTRGAIALFRGEWGVSQARLFGDRHERRAWLKLLFFKFPARYVILYLYHLIWRGAWRAGRVGWIWARLRTEAYRSMEFKYLEMKAAGTVYPPMFSGPGAPDPRAHQAED